MDWLLHALNNLTANERCDINENSFFIQGFHGNFWAILRQTKCRNVKLISSPPGDTKLAVQL
jgi:hypothetical protein